MVYARPRSFQFATHANSLDMIVSNDPSWWSTIDWNRSLSYFTGSWSVSNVWFCFDVISQWQRPLWWYMIGVSKVFYQWLSSELLMSMVFSSIDFYPRGMLTHYRISHHLTGDVFTGWSDLGKPCPTGPRITLGLRQLILGRGSAGLSWLVYISWYYEAYIIPLVSHANLKYS
jgi:hypothetical protein